MKKLLYLIFALTISSCGTGEPQSGWTKHIYKNISDHKVELNSYFDGVINESLSYGIKESKTFDYCCPRGEGNLPADEPRYSAVDSVVTIFDDTLSVMYDRGRLDGNPMRIENYELTEAETEPYIYLFEFTNEDYERALERGRAVSP